MAKIKLTQPGFENYNGQMGVHFFEGGLSVHDVEPKDARRIAAVMSVEWEHGGNPSVAQSILDNQHTPAPLFTAGGAGVDHDAAAAATKLKAEAAASLSDTPQTAASAWTREKLEALADKDGIKGLRAVAPEGVKGSSIKELITAILNAPVSTITM